MADVSVPGGGSTEVQAYQWPNTKDDYELLDVIGEAVLARTLEWITSGVMCILYSVSYSCCGLS